MTQTSSLSEVEELFVKEKQTGWEKFTPERVQNDWVKIKEMYVDGVGISLSNLSYIMYNYVNSRRNMEGIAFHLYGLVATKSGNTGRPNVFFIKISDIGRTEYAVCPSIWHNLDQAISDFDDNQTSLSSVSPLSNSASSSSSVSSSSDSSSIEAKRVELSEQWARRADQEDSISGSASSSSSSVTSAQVSVLQSLASLLTEISQLISKFN